MRGVVGWIQVNGDSLGLATQPLAVALDHHVRQRVPEPVEILRSDGILESRQRGLRRKGVPVDRVAPEKRFVDRIVGQTSGIVLQSA